MLGRLGPVHVPAGQAQLELTVLSQKPLTQGKANATAGTDDTNTKC